MALSCLDGALRSRVLAGLAVDVVASLVEVIVDISMKRGELVPRVHLRKLHYRALSSWKR